jgi:hypothetical protein
VKTFNAPHEQRARRRQFIGFVWKPGLVMTQVDDQVDIRTDPALLDLLQKDPLAEFLPMKSTAEITRNRPSQSVY